MQALKGVPTCYIFACPQSHHGIPPLHCLVPYGAGREPGLILLSSSGEARVWDSIGIGLAGGSHYSTIQLDIPMDEIVTTFVRADVSALLKASIFCHAEPTMSTVSDIRSINVFRHPFPPSILLCWWQTSSHISKIRTSFRFTHVSEPSPFIHHRS